MTKEWVDATQVVFTAMRAQGPGGQHVNTSATAIHLRFDISASSLLKHIKERLLNLNDERITANGDIIIKAQGTRSQLQNKTVALQRLNTLIDDAAYTPPKRIPSKPSRAAKRARMDRKTQQSQKKNRRSKVIYERN